MEAGVHQQIGSTSLLPTLLHQLTGPQLATLTQHLLAIQPSQTITSHAQAAADNSRAPSYQATNSADKLFSPSGTRGTSGNNAVSPMVGFITV
jgi:hypothetical protein